MLVVGFKNFSRQLKRDLETFQRQEYLSISSASPMVQLPEELKFLKRIKQEIIKD